MHFSIHKVTIVDKVTPSYNPPPPTPPGRFYCLSAWGNALLVGVGGTGRQSLTRMVAHMCSYNCSRLSWDNYESFHEDLKKIYHMAGVKNEDPVFLILHWYTGTTMVLNTNVYCEMRNSGSLRYVVFASIHTIMPMVYWNLLCFPISLKQLLFN